MPIRLLGSDPERPCPKPFSAELPCTSGVDPTSYRALLQSRRIRCPRRKQRVLDAVALGRRLAGAWRGPVTALVLAYGAGDPLICPSQVSSHALGAQLLGFCRTGGFFRNPPIISYHFQHPWTVGLPIAVNIALGEAF